MLRAAIAAVLLSERDRGTRRAPSNAGQNRAGATESAWLQRARTEGLR